MSHPGIAQAPYDYSTSTPPPPPPKAGQAAVQDAVSRGPPLPPTPGHNGPVAYNEAIAGHNQSGQFLQQQQHYVTRPQNGWLPQFVHDLSTQDLKALLESPQLQTAILNNLGTSHASIAASQKPLHDLLNENVALAISLQQLEARVSQQQSATQSRLLALRALERQHKSKIVETEDTLRNFSPMALYQRLNSSVQEQDALVKGIEESFLEQSGMASDREVADFVRRVREAKRLSFLRSERKERWDEGRVGGWR